MRTPQVSLRKCLPRRLLVLHDHHNTQPGAVVVGSTLAGFDSLAVVRTVPGEDHMILAGHRDQVHRIAEEAGCRSIRRSLSDRHLLGRHRNVLGEGRTEVGHRVLSALHVSLAQMRRAGPNVRSYGPCRCGAASSAGETGAIWRPRWALEMMRCVPCVRCSRSLMEIMRPLMELLSRARRKSMAKE